MELTLTLIRTAPGGVNEGRFAGRCDSGELNDALNKLCQ